MSCLEEKKIENRLEQIGESSYNNIALEKKLIKNNFIRNYFYKEKIWVLLSIIGFVLLLLVYIIYIFF